MDDAPRAETFEHAGWIPSGAQWRDGELHVDWCHLGNRPLAEPFFEDTIALAMREPFNLLFRHRTPIDALRAWHERRPGVRPAGFVFHLSRCGSTLVAQMLSTRDDSVVLAEPASIDVLLHHRASSPADEAKAASRLQWLVSALGQPRSGRERHLFVKFDSWHVLDLPLIREAFPAVPWVFLYRDPLEVLASQMKQRGAHMVPGMLGPGPAGVDRASALCMPPEEYAARMLADVCAAALRHAHDPRALLVNYRDLPDAVATRILPHFGVACSEAERDAMTAKARYDAKHPAFEFSREEDARKAPSPAAIEAAQQWVRPLYDRLEAVRTQPDRAARTTDEAG